MRRRAVNLKGMSLGSGKTTPKRKWPQGSHRRYRKSSQCMDSKNSTCPLEIELKFNTKKERVFRIYSLIINH